MHAWQHRRQPVEKRFADTIRRRADIRTGRDIEAPAPPLAGNDPDAAGRFAWRLDGFV